MPNRHRAAAPLAPVLVLLSAVLALAAGRAQAATPDPLAAYIDQALRHNTALAAEHGSVQAQLAALREARARRWPQLSLKARYTRAEGGREIEVPVAPFLNPVYSTLNQLTGSSDFPTLGNVNFALLREREQETKLSLVAPLFAPQLGAAVDAEEALYASESAAREALARTVVRDVKQAAYGLAQAQAGVVIFEASELTLAENVRVAESLVEAGKATRDRILRAEAERQAVIQRLDAGRAQVSQARRYLNYLRGQALDAPLDAPERLEIPQSYERQQRPELRQLEQAVVAAEARTRAARAGSWPTLALAADYGYQGEEYRFGDEDDFSIASLVLEWRLFDFGERSAQRAQARAEAAALRARQRDLTEKLSLAERAARENLGTALRAIATAEARQMAAEEGFRIASRKRDAGQLSQIEFLDAERTFTDARLNLVIARNGALAASAELEHATAAYPLPALNAPE
jgi:outer membrane protein